MSSQAIAHPKTTDSERYEAFMREITPMDKPEKELANNSEDQEDSRILEDPELAGLALQLRQTRPPIVDPAYQEALQAKLIEIVLAERPRKGPDEVGDVETESGATGRANTSETDDTQSTDELDVVSLEDDAELAALACHLQQTVPTVPIDPRFQEALQEKLLEVVRRPPGAARKKRHWGLLALKSGYQV